MNATRLAKWLFLLWMLALGGPSSFAQDASQPPTEDAAGQGNAAVDETASDQPASDKPATDEVAREQVAAEKGAPEADALLTRQYHRAMLIDVRGPIFAPLKSYVDSRIEAAKRGKVDLIVFRIHSPGGGLNESIELARSIGRIDWATTIAYIPEEAFSGAAILVLGCDRIIMHPRAVIGDAGPIEWQGDAFRFVEQKKVSAIAASVGQLAETKNRPAALGEAMVDRTLNVFEATDKVTKERTYLTSEQIKLKEMVDQYDIGPALPETGLDRYLTVGGTRAVELGLAEGTFDSEEALLSSLSYESIKTTERTWVDATVYWLNRPVLTGLLLLIGLIGLYVELTVPGISVAGLVSLLCFGLFFWSHALGGTSGWLEVMLFALGISLLAIEIFVLPGTGLFGLVGVVLVVLSLVMASQDFVLPTTAVQWTTMRNNLLMVLGAVAAVVVALVVQIAYFDWIPGLGRLRLDTPDASSAGSVTLATESGLLLPEPGEQGHAESVLRPAGKVRFGQSLVDVVTEGDFLDPGTAVEVVKREGNRVVVRKI